MESSGAQVVIPDLDDEDDFYQPQPETSTSNATSSPPRPSRGPFRGAELNYHNRNGSGTGSATSEEWDNNFTFSSTSQFATVNSNSSSNQSQNQFVNVSSTSIQSSSNTATPNPASSSSSSYRFPPGNPNQSSTTTTTTPSSFSFPRKASFASLKAAIKGQSSNNAASSGAGGNGSSGFNGASVVSPLDAFPPGMGLANFSRNDGGGYGSDYGSTGMSTSNRRGGGTTPSAVGGGGKHSRPSSPSASKFSTSNSNHNNHGRQASYFSEQSIGATSSSADSQGQGNHPPLPPFPESLPGQSYNSFQHRHQYSNSSSNAAGVNQGTSSSNFTPNLPGVNPNFNFDLKQLRGGSGGGRVSNDRDRGGLDSELALGSPFLGGGNGSGFSSIPSGKGGATGTKPTPKPSPQPYYTGGYATRRENSADEYSLDLRPMGSLEASSISDPISPDSVRGVGNHQTLGVSAEGFYSQDGAKTPTIPKSSNGDGSGNRSRVGIGTSSNDQFGMNLESQGLGTLPRGIGTIDPSTPAEYAMNVLMSRFITLAGLKVQGIMERNVNAVPNLSLQLGQGQDPIFDSLLESLAHISKKNAKPILDSLFCWRNLVLDSKVDSSMVRKSMLESSNQAGSSTSSSSVMGGSKDNLNSSSFSSNSTSNNPIQNQSANSVKDVATKLTKRKTFTTQYLLVKALIQISRQLSKNSLNENGSSALQKEVFELLRECISTSSGSSSNAVNVVGMMKDKDKDKAKISTSNLDVSSSVGTGALGMQAACFEMVSELIGELSRTHFVSVGDRFISALEQSSKARSVASSTSSASKEKEKDFEAATEAHVQAMKHLTITIFPLESFEEGAEFVEVLSRFFVASHGHRIKSAYAQTLTHLLLRVATSASAEVNHPTWLKAVDAIWPRAVAMTSKPRYWSVAFPLYVSLLTVSPEDKFSAHWFSAVETAVAKLKDRGHRNIVLNAAVRLLWVYAFRCHESTNGTAKRLDSFFRLWFPASRRHVTPAEGSHAAHVVMLHIVLFRHFDYGRDLIYDFLRSTALSGNTLSLQPDVLSRSRMTIAIKAILLTLDHYVKGEQPAFPDGADFVTSDFEESISACGDELPPDFTYPTADIGAAQDKFNDLIGKIALICEHQVSDVNVFDERIIILRGSGGAAAAAAGSLSDKALVEREGLVWRTHLKANFTVAYIRDHQPYFDLLHACFQSWPRCLSSNLSFPTVLSILFRSHFSADPSVAEASSETLRRIAKQRRGGATAVVSGFMRWIFRPETNFWEVHHDQILLLPKVEQAVSLWIEFLNFWLSELREIRADGEGPAMKGLEMERTSAWAIIDEVEAYGLLLLCSGWQPLRRQATIILKVVAALDETFLSPSRRQALAAARLAGEEEEPGRIIHLLNKPCANYCDEEDPQLTPAQQARASKWRRASNVEALSGLAESQNSVEHSLWQHVLPHFLRMCLEYFPTTVAVFRSHVTNRVPSMDQAVAHAAGTAPKMPATSGGALGTISNSSGKPQAIPSLTADQILMAEHWKLYILALCTTTTSTEGSRGAVAMGHRRQSSESGSERVIAARDLFQKLVPFLASDQSRFRDAVITALGNINSNLYRALLETMQAVCSQLNEDWRSRSMGRSGQKKSRRHERLRTAIGHVILLTTPHLAKTSVLDDEATVQMLLGWVRDTYNFLNDREIKPDAGFNRLRRFLCGVVEQLFDGISSRGEVDKHFNFELRTKMFRTFRDWHALSQAGEEGPGRFAEMLSSAAAQFRDESQRDNALSAINRIRAEVEQLSFRAGSAMASLCQSSITELGPNDHSSTQAVEAGSLFSWLDNLFSNPSYQTHPVARRAMRALLTHNETHSALIGKAVEYSFQEPERISSGRSFFMVLADVILERSTIKVALHQAFCLALVKLGHPDGEMRRKAFAMLDHVARSQQPDLALNDLEVGVGSPLPAIYLRAQRDVSMYLAKSFRPIRAAMLSEYTARLPVIDRARRATTLGLLPEWIRGHDLLERGSLDGEVEQQKQRQQPPQFGGGGNQGEPLYSTHLILTNLLFLTIKYSDEHNFEIQEMWASLANSEDLILNANVIIKFLVEQTLKHRSPAFVVNAKRVVSCLSNTVIGPHMFDELCSLIEPGSMIPVPHEGDFNSVDAALRDLHLADLERALPTVSRKHAFSPGQLALFFVGELTYERSEQLGSHLPVLLHSIFMQIDSSSPFVQEQATSIFEQMMRSLVSGASSSAGLTSNEEKDSDAGKQENGARGGKTKVEQLLGRGMAIWWTNESAGAELDETRTPRSMRSTLSEILTILEPLYPDLRERWGTVALLWATSNPVRHLACRSFQAFRVLLPATNPSMLANMLGRLSNTVSDPSPDIQSFALEILHTFKAVIKAADPSQQELFCQTFWATVACLSTINENEFAEAIAMLNSLLDKVDIGSTEVIEMLKIKCPEGWEGEPGGIQPLVLRGLKSSVTSDASFSILNRLSQIKNPALIDSTDGRIAFLFVAALPWFLQSTDQPIEDRDETIFALADNVAALAEEVGKKDLNRVATSIAKSRFRTKDDLIRQAVGCVRSNYLPSLGPELVVLLLGLTLNEKDWMRKQTMQVLKIFFQVIDTRSEAFANLGSELLMPLLRLLSTPLSSQALEVLDEPITITGGPAANQILRMSLQWGNKGNKFNSNQRREQASDASIFGAPDDSGWAVAHPQDLTTRTRINVQAVFKTCELTLDVTPIDSNVNFVVDDDYEMDQDQPDFDFLPDERSFRGENEGDETASVGDLVNQLHDLSSFFVDEPSNSSARPPQSASTTGFEYEASQTSIVAKILGNSSFSAAGSSSRGGTESPVSRRPFDLDLERPSLSRKGTAELNLSSLSSKEEGGSSENDSGNGKGRSKEVGGWGRRSMFKMGGSNRRDSLQSHAKSAGSNMKHQG